MHRLDPPEADNVQADAGELQLVMQSGDLGQVVRQPVQRLDDDHIEPNATGLREQVLIPRPIDSRP